jgi:hypothetical protein
LKTPGQPDDVGISYGSFADKTPKIVGIIYNSGGPFCQNTSNTNLL